MTAPATVRQRVLVTGASSGIGATAARVLAEAGFFVYAGVRREEDGAAIEAALGERVRAVIVDVTRPEGFAALRDRFERDGGLYGLVNNAGIVVAAPLEFIPLDALRRQFEVNLFGPIALTQALLPLLRRSVGRIVNVGSIAGRTSMPFMSPYAASKHALRVMTDALRMELAPFEIGVSLIEPGAVTTPIWERSRASNSALNESLPQEARDLYNAPMQALTALSADAVKRATAPEKVAEAIRHALTAAQPRSHYLIGNDARAQLAFNALPTRMRERFFARALNRVPPSS